MIQLPLLLLQMLPLVFSHRLLPLRCVESLQTSSTMVLPCLSELVLKTHRVTHS